MTAENEVRITLTQIYEKQDRQGKELSAALVEQSKEFTAGLAKINTSLAVLGESVKPQTGINAEIFRRVLSLEKKVYALPSIATVISLAGLVVAIMAMNAK